MSWQDFWDGEHSIYVNARHRMLHDRRIASDIADGAQSLIREQVEMGVAVRMAVLEALASHLPNG